MKIIDPANDAVNPSDILKLTPYRELELKAAAMVEAVNDNPNGRLQLRKNFYKKYGYPNIPGHYGFGNSEIAFMEWEIERGVLNSPDDPQQPGSTWWRATNLEFIYLSELAALVHEAGLEVPDLPNPVFLWLNYIQHPSPSSWYRAHNASIVTAYINQVSEASKESKFEIIFINDVLSRLLFAEAMVEGKAFGNLGNFFANPKLPTVELLVNLPDFYPKHYPLTKEDIIDILHKGHSLEDDLVRILDEGLIEPHLVELYNYAGKILSIPQLNDFVHNDKTDYPEINKIQDSNVKGPVAGYCQSYIALLEMDVEETGKLLPDCITLVQHPHFPAGKHPVFFFFNHNRLHATWFSWPVFKYHEVAVLVPYVHYKDSTIIYAFTPTLYADSWLVAWLGKIVWKFNKMMAIFKIPFPFPKGKAWFEKVPQLYFDVRDEKKQELVFMECKNEGEEGTFNNIENLKKIQPLLALPGIMGTEGKYLGVTVGMNFKTAQIQPANGLINISNIPGITPQNVKVPDIRKSKAGGFRINWKITLSWPEPLG